MDKGLTNLLFSVTVPDPITIETGFPIFAIVVICPVRTGAVDAFCIMKAWFTLRSWGNWNWGGLRFSVAAGSQDAMCFYSMEFTADGAEFAFERIHSGVR